MIDWGQLVTGASSIVAIIAAVGVSVVWLDHRIEKSIDRLEVRLEKSIQKSDERHERTMEKNESHWREMFIYMNDRIDKVREK